MGPEVARGGSAPPVPALSTPKHGAAGLPAVLRRAAGFDDRSIHDATQVIGFFNYINRLADGLGVDRESGIKAWGDADG